MTDDRWLVDFPPDIVEKEPRYRLAYPNAAVWHLDGVDWFHTPRPRWLHRHWAQTVGQTDRLFVMYRCACGAYGGPGQVWLRKL